MLEVTVAKTRYEEDRGWERGFRREGALRDED
jgi:hypothetical protein